MEKVIRVLCVTMITLMLVCGAALAEDFNARGSAIVSGFTVRYKSGSKFTVPHIYVTNVSSSDVTCKITVYDEDGSDVTTLYARVTAGSQPDDGTNTISTGTGTFDIPPRGTRVFRYGESTMNRFMRCHATIEWTSDDLIVRKALVANLNTTSCVSGAYYSTCIDINGGEVF